MLRRFRTALLAPLFLAALAPHASAQDAFPSMPIRMVIGFSAGGGTDAVLRTIAAKMGPLLGTTVVVDNKPGANGNVAGDIVAKAKADGYTLLYNTSSMVTSPALYPNLTYDYRKDLTPVALTVNVPMVLVTAPTGAKNVRDFVAQAKAKPGALTYGSGGRGNITHLANLVFQQAAGISALHAPYKGEAPALADLLGGHIQFYMGTAAGVASLVNENKINGLAVMSSQRLQALPNVPTMSEAGMGKLELGSWSGVMAPAGTPPAVVAKINKALRDVLADPSMVASLTSQGAQVKAGSVEAYAAFLESESELWGTLIKRHRIEAD